MLDKLKVEQMNRIKPIRQNRTTQENRANRTKWKQNAIDQAAQFQRNEQIDRIEQIAQIGQIETH